MNSPSDKPPVDLATLLSSGLFQWRVQRGIGRREFAMAAQGHGLAWSESILLGVEQTGRHLTLVEALLLPFVLAELEGTDAGERLTLGDTLDTLFGSLFDDDDPVSVGTTTLPMGDVMRLAGAGAQGVIWDGPANPKPKEPPEWADIDKRAAKKLGLSQRTVRIVSTHAFGHSLGQERENRMQVLTNAGLPESTLRASRGHVTRRLLDDLATYRAKNPRIPVEVN
jgi:hypothetical protein